MENRLKREEEAALQCRFSANAARIVIPRSVKSFSKYNRSASGRTAAREEDENYKYVSKW